MVKNYPALDIVSDPTDRLLATLDDLSPTAIDERADALRVFFSTRAARDEAQSALAPHFAVTALEVSDEDWARRSQADLEPVTVGRITLFPNPQSLPNPPSPGPEPFPIAIVITPSMGFGTGHHATTRLCLAALQSIDVTGAFVLDVGTGSGVLAIAAGRLGAARALGIDHDADALQSAQDNLAVNAAAHHVMFALDDLRTAALPPADVVVANLTGALLMASGPVLLGAVRAGGALIVSGLLAHERGDIVRALGVQDPSDRRGLSHGQARILWEREEDGWVGLAVKKP